MENTRTESVVSAGLSVEFDTSFVLFFLAMEIGRIGAIFSLDGILMIAALGALLLMPYLLNAGEQATFSNWLAGRSVIAGFGIAVGAVYAAATGTLLPEMFSFAPFMMLIVACMFTVFLTFSSLLGFRRQE